MDGHPIYDSSVAGNQLFIVGDGGLTNFLPRLASNHNHPDLYPWGARITGIYHHAQLYLLFVMNRAQACS
jgi:hypothetical protein